MLKAKIITTKRGRQGGVFAQVRTDASQIVDNVLLIFQHNTSTKPLIKERNDSNLVLLVQGYQNDLIYGFPYDPLLEDALKNGEYKAGNLSKDSFIFFNEDGNILIQNSNNDLISLNDGNVSIKNGEGKNININQAGNIAINGLTGKIELNNNLETLSSLITQLITLLQNFISVDNPITPTITVQPDTATQNAITTLQTNFAKLIA
jgi:hypothetical protein